MFKEFLQNFPSFFSSERKRVFTKTIEVALDKFKSLEIASIDELPYRKFLPVLREDKKLTFIGEIIEHVIKQNEFVKEIRLNNFLSGILIYDAKVEKVLQGKYSTIFSIPENKNKKSIYNSKELISFFDLSFTEHKLQKWSDVDKRKTLFRRRIGFTQQPLERLTQGHEVKIWVDYHDLTQNKYYVFIEGLSVVEIKDKETYKQYYLYSPTTIKKLEDIYRLLAERHPTYRNIGIGWLFYDEVIDFQKNSKNYKEFEAKLFRRVRVDLKPGGVMVERVEKKGEKDYSWWGMNKYSALQFSENYVTTFDPELEELAAKYDAMDGNEQHYLDDLRADFYSDML